MQLKRPIQEEFKFQVCHRSLDARLLAAIIWKINILVLIRGSKYARNLQQC